MDDAFTRQALDELAELYLTGPLRADARESKRSADAPVNTDEIDLRDEADRPSLQIGAARRVRPIVEAVFVGHLPGYASPWVSQYADELAARRGCAALVRVDSQDHSIGIELIGEDVAEAPSSAAPNEAPIQVLQRLGRRVGAWLMVLEVKDDQPSSRRALDAPRWTILSGCDTIAVVGAYKLLKSLLEGDDAPAPSKNVRLMIMGADEDEAVTAVTKINRAASAFLHTPIELAGVRKRMQPVRRRGFERIELDPSIDPWMLLNRFFEQLETDEQAASPRPQSELAMHLTNEELEALTDPQFASQAAVESPPLGCAGDRPPVMAKPAPAPRAQSAEDAASPDDLSAYLDEAAPLAARCPRYPHVQLAVDGEGRLHACCFVERSPVHRAMRDLIDAGAWAAEHAALLALTCRDLEINQSARPTLHLFCGEAKAAAELSCTPPQHHPPIRLHLLKPVSVGGQTVYVHEELN